MKQYFLITMSNLILVFAFWGCNSTVKQKKPDIANGIEINQKQPFYWSYNGKPVLLIGGSIEDNLFQTDSLEAHLRLLKSVGGNYIRCTMSARDTNNVKPFAKNSSGQFNLNLPDKEYWQRLENLLYFASELEIIVQIEIWATYDFYWGAHSWAENPFNPKLNINYTTADSGLPDTIDHPAQSAINPFFQSVPELGDNQILLNYQKKFVDKLLEVSLPYNNVLYAIDNETNANYKWGQFWSSYLHRQAQKYGKKIYVSEMWDSWDPSDGEVQGAIMQSQELSDWFAEHLNPDLHKNANFTYSLNDTTSYQFLDVSNNNAQKGETHYQTAIWVRNAVLASGKIRPINNVKIYGGDRDRIWSGNHRDGRERFWRDIFAGHAAVRFHRPPSGIALSNEAQNQIKSLRMLTDKLAVFELTPSNEILSDRDENEAFCLANLPKNELLLYFPSKGSVEVKTQKGTYDLYRIDIAASVWEKEETIELPGAIANSSDNSCAIALIKQ